MKKPALKVIYEPSGAALENAPLAVNLFTGCSHGCKYCYAPGVLRMDREAFHASPKVRDNILDLLNHDCEILARAGDRREIMLCFTTDPYQDNAEFLDVTRSALKTIASYGLPFTVLTKGGTRACRDFDILKAAGARFGTSLVWYHDVYRSEQEPHAANVYDRIAAIKEALQMGIPTWVSLEPVIDPWQAVRVVHDIDLHVDKWAIGIARGKMTAKRRADLVGFCRRVNDYVPPEKLQIKNSLKAIWEESAK